MKERDLQAEIMQRFHSVRGHLEAVIQMTEVGRPCDELLYQLNAVQAALRAIGIKLIACQAQDSRTVILRSSSPEERIFELKRIQALYTIFLQHSVPNSEVSRE